MVQHQCIAVIAMVAVTTFVTAQNNVAPCFKEDETTPQSSKLGVQQFGLQLFRELASASPDRSIFISPYSIYSAFLMAYFGSGGRTQQQLAKALGVQGKTSTFSRFKQLQFLLENPYTDDGAVVTTLNKAYFDQLIPLKTCISQLIHNIEHIDFRNQLKAAEIINQEASTATRGKIPNLIDPRMLRGAQFVLLNAVYFKGVWEIPFEKQGIRPTDFTDGKGKVIGQVDMMFGPRDKGLITEAPALGSQILELPYVNSTISMFLILPDVENQGGVDAVLRRLTPDNLRNSIRRTPPIRVFLGVPKFKMETTLTDDLKQAVGRLGVLDLFTGQGELTSFSHVPLRADSVVHKAVVEVSEEGTEAAAATAIIGTRAGSPRKRMVFDRPFIFLIHDTRTGVTLFSGVFRHPDDTTPL